jgi:hypothetical protein
VEEGAGGRRKVFADWPGTLYVCEEYAPEAEA